MPTRVLVVDDDKTCQLLAVLTLRDHGYVVDSVSSGDAAVDLAAPGRYDAVLTDLVMPDTDGLETARLIRGRDPNVTIIGISSYESPVLMKRCVDSGMSAVLLKPFDIDAFVLALGIGPLASVPSGEL